MNESRRQWVLVGVLIVLGLVWVSFGGYSFESGGAFSIEMLPPIDAAGLERQLTAINTVNDALIETREYDKGKDRNLFQYGVKPLPPPPPVDYDALERQRLAEQARLAEIEARARAQREAELEKLKQQADRAREAAENAPKIPPKKDSAKPPPPTIRFRYLGVFGPERQRIGVLLDGDEPLLVRKGQVVKKHFKVLDIGVEWADVGYVDPEYKDQMKRLYLGS